MEKITKKEKKNKMIQCDVFILKNIHMNLNATK